MNLLLMSWKPCYLSSKKLRVPCPFLPVSNRRCARLLRWCLGVALSLTFPASAGTYAWHVGEGYRYAQLPDPGSGKTGFTLMPVPVTGVTFTNHLSDKGAAE